ncbi:MAG: hypothetical protein L0Y57_13620 [Beijerinckiaceae bacterium]|nr:hypothetical protein [Beijerinckiaceae bacterium]
MAAPKRDDAEFFRNLRAQTSWAQRLLLDRKRPPRAGGLAGLLAPDPLR